MEGVSDYLGEEERLGGGDVLQLATRWLGNVESCTLEYLNCTNYKVT